MYKIRLVIADPDHRYVDGVAEYINFAAAGRFRISCFTEPSLCLEHLKSTREKTDILLAHPQFLLEEVGSSGYAAQVLVISEGFIDSRLESYTPVNRYLPGDKLVQLMLSLFAEAGSHATHVGGTRETRIIAVYSPAGGAGKTSVTYGLAARFSEEGLSPFVITLESICAFPVCADETCGSGLSRILMSIAEKEGQVSNKINQFKKRDAVLNFDFLEPPECFSEMAEIKAEHLHKLFGCIRATGTYDIVLVDLDSSFDDRTSAVFELSDSIVVVRNLHEMGQIKFKTFWEQVNRCNFDFAAKLIPVINKYIDGPPAEEDGTTEPCPILIPEIPSLWRIINGQLIFDVEHTFSGHLAALAQRLTSGRAQRE